jgi:hypothetical protein
VERVVLNALRTSPAALPPNICAFGDLCAIVLRTRRSTNAAGVTPKAFGARTKSLITTKSVATRLWGVQIVRSPQLRRRRERRGYN